MTVFATHFCFKIQQITYRIEIIVSSRFQAKHLSSITCYFYSSQDNFYYSQCELKKSQCITLWGVLAPSCDLAHFPLNLTLTFWIKQAWSSMFDTRVSKELGRMVHLNILLCVLHYGREQVSECGLPVTLVLNPIKDYEKDTLWVNKRIW